MNSGFKSKFIIILILATPIISLSFSSQRFFSPMMQTNFQNSNTSDRLEKNAEESNGLLWNSVSGLTGEITAPLVIDYRNSSKLTEVVYVGTERGLKVLKVINPIVKEAHKIQMRNFELISNTLSEAGLS